MLNVTRGWPWSCSVSGPHRGRRQLHATARLSTGIPARGRTSRRRAHRAYVGRLHWQVRAARAARDAHARASSPPSALVHVSRGGFSTIQLPTCMRLLCLTVVSARPARPEGLRRILVQRAAGRRRDACNVQKWRHGAISARNNRDAVWQHMPENATAVVLMFILQRKR